MYIIYGINIGIFNVILIINDIIKNDHEQLKRFSMSVIDLRFVYLFAVIGVFSVQGLVPLVPSYERLNLTELGNFYATTVEFNSVPMTYLGWIAQDVNAGMFAFSSGNAMTYFLPNGTYIITGLPYPNVTDPASEVYCYYINMTYVDHVRDVSRCLKIGNMHDDDTNRPHVKRYHGLVAGADSCRVPYSNNYMVTADGDLSHWEFQTDIGLPLGYPNSIKITATTKRTVLVKRTSTAADFILPSLCSMPQNETFFCDTFYKNLIDLGYLQADF